MSMKRTNRPKSGQDCFPGYTGFGWEPYRAENLKGRQFTAYELTSRVHQVRAPELELEHQYIDQDRSSIDF